MTKQYKRDQAVAWLKRELEFLRRAGYVNGRNLTCEEQEQNPDRGRFSGEGLGPFCFPAKRTNGHKFVRGMLYG